LTKNASLVREVEIRARGAATLRQSETENVSEKDLCLRPKRVFPVGNGWRFVGLTSYAE
jgi:hypothetical protein